MSKSLAPDSVQFVFMDDDDITAATLAFDFDKNQPRRYDGRWVKVPGSGLSKKLTEDFKKLTNQDVADLHHEMHGKKKWTASQAKALNYYASDGHKPMNQSLRGHIKPDAKTTKSISDAKAGLRPTSRDIRVYRGTTPSQFGVKSVDELKQHIGEVFHDPAFASTSVNRMNKVMSGSPLRLEIEVPKGTPGAYIADISNNPGEQEFLLGPDLHYELMEVKDTPIGYAARLRVVPKPKATEEPAHEVALDPATDVELPKPIEEVSAPKPLEKVSTPSTAASSKPVVPAVIYKKHDDGAVVGHSSSGQRMRWDAGRKKFIVEQQKGDGWAEESAHTKTSAYNEMKNPDKWFEPTETGPENGPSEPSQRPETDLSDTDTTASEAPEAPADSDVADEPEMVDGDTLVPPDIDAVPADDDVAPTSTPAELGMSAADAQKFISDWGKNVGLTDDDRKTLDDWASPDMSAMRSMQTHLQNGGELTSDEVALRDKLDNLAERGKLPEAVKAYRVVKPWDDIKGDVDGKTITEHGFQSASLQPKDVIGMWGAAYAAAGQDPVIFEMNIPKDTPAFTPEWNKSTFAHELTLGRDVDMKITGTREETMFVPGLGKEHTFKVLTMDVTPREKKAPEIPKQADAPAVEMDDTPGVYTGPTAENYGGAPKDITDKVRQAQVAAIAHEHRTDALAEELRKDKSKYDGYEGWDKSIKDARAQLASEAPPDSDLDGALDELRASLPDYTAYDQVYRRLGLEAGVEVRMAKFTEKNGLGELTPEVKADLTKRMKEAFTGKKVAVRVSAKTVEHILNDGRIKSQFETNKSSGKKDFGVRVSIERAIFGINDKPHQNAEKRPIYGYVAMDGIRPAGVGSAQLGDPSTDALTQYGQVQVVLKDSVRDRTTAMFGDSMNNMTEAIPTPINNPDWRSFQASRGGITGKGLEGLDRSGENQEFRAGAYAEAQIHDGVSVDDIEEIVFPSNPTATVKDQLAKAGIPYRVLTFKSAADGSDEERATALRIAEEDKPFIEGEIKKLQDKIPTLVDKSYAQKDLAKYEKQLKAINDALPALRGEKKSTKSKVAAAKEKVAKATAPKQAEAPKIESTGSTKLSAAEEQELTALQNQISELYGQSGYWRMREAEITHKGNGGILTPEDLKDSKQAYEELKKLRDAATPLTERELELRMKRDGDVFGEVNDVNAERWASKAKPSTVMLPGNDPAKIEKIADSYRVNDKATTEHNMSLRSDEPTQAAVAWRSRMKRMINSQQLNQDAVVYRGAALTPDRIMQLRPGAVMIDPGSMSTDESRGSAEFYMKTRLDDLPGTLGTVFEIRAPKGMPAADVEYGEFVFDFHTPMRIISTKRENGIVNVVAELVPPGQAKLLYGAPPVPKAAAKTSAVNLNAGKKGSINAKEAKRYQEDFAKAGLQPSSSAQEIYDKAKSKAYYNDRSIMQILEAIDAMKPGYKKTVLDWLKTPEGIDYVSKKATA